MGTLSKNDRNLMGFLSSLASSRQDALCKIIRAANTSDSLEELRAEIEKIFEFYQRAGHLLEESFTNSLEP